MTKRQAQRWIVSASLLLSFGLLSFFIVAPYIDLHFSSLQAQSLVQITLPPFFGYLGTAVRSVLSSGAESREKPQRLPPLMVMLMKGPLYLFCAVFCISIGAFEYSQRPEARPGSGMTPDQLAWLLSVALALLSITTHGIVGYLFGERVEAATLPGGSPAGTKGQR